MTRLRKLTDEIRGCRICADRFRGTTSAHAPRPVPWLSTRAPILISGQAPGARVHASGIPFDDPSGDRLRDWLGVDRDTFYDRTAFAILPMAFCFPGYDARGSDLPPPPVCAQTWRHRALAIMPQVRLSLLVGAYAQRAHLPGQMGVTERVRDWQQYIPGALPLPHPSWRNTAWLRKNAFFEEDVVPWLRSRVCELLS